MQYTIVSLLITMAMCGAQEVKVELGKFSDVVLSDGVIVIHKSDEMEGVKWVIGGQSLVIARYSLISSGCRLEKYSLDGKLMYKVELQGLGPISHSKYRNEVAVEIDGEAVVVKGKESQGSYLEKRNISDGSLIENIIQK